MSGQLVGGIAGAAIGSMFGPMGAQIGWMAGSMIGGMIDPQKIEGPRLEDLTAFRGSAYGLAIPKLFGTSRFGGIPVWATPKQEVKSDEGKGGPQTTTFSYYGNWAVLLCEGEGDVVQIFANGEIMLDLKTSNEGSGFDYSLLGGGGGTGGVNSGNDVYSPVPNIRIYRGTTTQEPDPLIESHQGVGRTRAYRGYIYIVFEMIALEKYGNTIPQISAVATTSGVRFYPDPVSIGHGGFTVVRDPETGYLWTNDNVVDGVNDGVTVLDPITGDTIATIIVPAATMDAEQLTGPLTFVENIREVWIGGVLSIFRFSATGMAFLGKFAPSGGIGGPGLVTYLPDSGLVVATGSIAHGLISPFDRTTVAIFGTGSLGAVTPLTGTSLFAIASPIDLTEHTIDIELRDSHTGNLYDTATIPDPSGTSDGPFVMPYDPVRNRLVYIPANGTTQDAYTIDVDTWAVTHHSIGTGTDVSSDYGALYHTVLDKIFVSGISSGDVVLSTLNAETLALEDQQSYSTAQIAAARLIEALETSEYIYGVNKFSAFAQTQTIRIFLTPRIGVAKVRLSDVVEELCTTTQLVSSEVNVTELTDLMDGYVIAAPMSRRDAIASLLPVYFFDAIESAGKGKFVKRGGVVRTVIPLSKLIQDEEEPLDFTRESDLELPLELGVTYIDKNRDYQDGNQYARRTTKPSLSSEQLRCAVVMDGDKGQQIAEVNLYQRWSNRTPYKFKTTWEYLRLEPTDIIQVETETVTHTLRLTSKTVSPALEIEWEAVSEDTDLYTAAGVGGTTSYAPQTIHDMRAGTLLQLLDIPILRDEDDDEGFYGTAVGSNENWTGTEIRRSVDGGVTYAAQTAIDEASVIGGAITVLPDYAGGNTFDELSSVTVRLFPGGTLSSTTRINVLAGTNTAVIGAPGRWEVIRFRDAVLVAERTYTLTGLLRGRRGTEHAMGSHAVGDTFILADEDSWARLSSDIGLERQWKGVTFGARSSSAPAQDFTNSAVGLKPYASVHLGGGRDADGNLTIKWVPRTRVRGQWRDNVDVPVGEDTEDYSIDIYDGPGYNTVVHTLSASSPTVAYSRALQDTHFGTSAPVEPCYVDIFKLSADVGRGYALRGSI